MNGFNGKRKRLSVAIKCLNQCVVQSVVAPLARRPDGIAHGIGHLWSGHHCWRKTTWCSGRHHNLSTTEEASHKGCRPSGQHSILLDALTPLTLVLTLRNSSTTGRCSTQPKSAPRR